MTINQPRHLHRGAPNKRHLHFSEPFFYNPVFYIILYFTTQIYFFLKIPIIGSLLLFIGFFLCALRYPEFKKIILKPAIIYFSLGYTLTFLIMSVMLEHGITNSSLVLAFRLLRYLPEFFMGIFLLTKPKSFFYFILFISIVVAFSGILSLKYSIDLYEQTGETAVRARHAVEHREGYTLGSEADMMAVGSIHSAAARSYYFLLAFGAFLFYSRMIRTNYNALALVLLLTILVTTVLSGLTLPSILVAIGLALYGRLRVKRLKNLLVALFYILIFIIGVIAVYRFEITLFTRYFDKAFQIFNSMLGIEGTYADVDRFQLFMVSLRTFFEYPIFGVGAHLYLPGAGLGLVGGHSSISDFPAQFGIVGNIGIIVVMLWITRTVIEYYRDQRLRYYLGEMRSFFLIFWVVIFLHSFVNPTLGAPDIMRLIYLCLGMMVAIKYNPNFYIALMPPARMR